MEKNILKSFVKYVSLNILGMLGLSCYILADTYFISKALGATGVAALNFSIAIYSVIHGIGLMIGIGGATRYSILKSQQDDKKADIVYTTSVKLGCFLGVCFVIIGIFGSESLARLLGADATTLPLTKTYLTTILCFAPFFILNNLMLTFVRNDHNPRLSMIAMLTGSFSNIILDYIFMFPLGMGMFGAAFATGLAPIISIGVMSMHFIRRKNNFRFIRNRISWASICDISSLGLAAFITEVSSAVILITFNLVILKIKGNLGVASYGIVANIALVGVSVFTGIGQGIQPIVSRGYGMGNSSVLKKVMRYALITSFGIATLIYIAVLYKAEGIVGIFNSEQSPEVASIAKAGLRIYFLGFFFAGINIIMAMYFSATERGKEAFMVSVTRGCILIVPMALLLSAIFKMEGIWLAFVLTEGAVTIITILMTGLRRNRKILK